MGPCNELNDEIVLTINSHCHPVNPAIFLIRKLSQSINQGINFKVRNTYMPNAISPEPPDAIIFPRKNHEKRLLVSSRLYQVVIVKRLPGMKPDSQILQGR